MDWILNEFREAYLNGSGSRLSTTLLPPSQSPNVAALDAFFRSSDEDNIRSVLQLALQEQSQAGLDVSREQLNIWVEVYAAYWKFLSDAITNNDDVEAPRRRYESWRQVTNALIKGFNNNALESWTLPCLYVAGRWLRTFAIEVDEEGREKGKDASAIGTLQSEEIAATVAKNDTLEDAARVFNRMFTLCITDRAPLVNSRKWGLYYMASLLFKTYFRLGSVSLCKNPYRALQVSHIDMPPLEAFPKSHVCTYKYYIGLIFFLEEEYLKAEEYLYEAYNLCHAPSTRNREMLLTYMIPCRLLTTRELPRRSTLEQHPRLQRLFLPICSAIRSGNLAKFDAALVAGEAELVKARIYLTLERSRDICLRNLFRKVFLAGGSEELTGKDGRLEQLRRTRVPVDEFIAAVNCSMGSKEGRVERDEVECLLANTIYKGMMKGYIARERAIVVLSKGSAFPGTGV